ncbi:MAG: 23S rRNA (pseudouridine(1915)-N(3))-methyltransferase RlmH [Verrucomicrobia bacterium]|nr:23S rRNA (pseudouridine(1915)-N(3))-methyltransferase RlmH [Verrucomicrobiota bacterium]MCH8528288.1 23S rRNA (pseudouridine(1915)-N(3))-methyltransferase RlmH [Kiritimatiellia bacterium]
MKWRIITTGKPSFVWSRDAAGEYEKRIRRFTALSVVSLKAGSDVAAYQKASEGCFRIALDERGLSLNTLALYDRVMAWEQEGTKEVSVWIGGSDGFGEAVKPHVDLTLRLGDFTLMHELALVVWLEQVYRVYTLKENIPYHRP